MEYHEIDHDAWAYGAARNKRVKAIKLNQIHGVLPFTGVRNPITTSTVSQKVMLTYKTAANGWQRKVGATDSAAEAAAAEEALIDPDVYDVEFQPLTFPYEYPKGNIRPHTIDLRVTFNSGLRRFVFVRNAESLSKPWVEEEIDAIHDAVPHDEAHEFMVVNADTYTRARRDNLRRMHRLVAYMPDPVSDQTVANAADELKTLWRISDLCGAVDLAPARVMKSCLRLIAAKTLCADMDAVICKNSRIWRAA